MHAFLLLYNFATILRRFIIKKRGRIEYESENIYKQPERCKEV